MDIVSYMLGKKAGGGTGGITIDDVIDITGELANLNTTDKSNLVNAINEIFNSSSGGGTEVLENANIQLGNVVANRNATHDPGFYIITGIQTVITYGLNGSTSQPVWPPNNALGLFIMNGEKGEKTDQSAYLFTNDPNPQIIIFIGNNKYKAYLTNLVNADKSNTFTDVQTFSVLPESSVAPTSNNQFSNKKYVDDSIASAITTTLGGSY